MEKRINYFLFIECTELNWNVKYANGFCVYILFKDMGWCLGVIGNIRNREWLTYIFVDEVCNGTPSIYNKSQYRGKH